MLAPHPPPRPAPTSPARPDTPVDIGVGIDTSRYGHYAAFLTHDLQTAAPDAEIPETAAGYAILRQRFQDLTAQHGRVHFRVRVDAAGPYADNLLAWLGDVRLDHATVAVSTGDPQRNKSYRVAVYGHQKSDPVEARACARYALTERPRGDPPMPRELRLLRQVAGRLQAVVRQRTRLVNQLHQLLARTFPELALQVPDLTAGWVLELVTRYPTARLLARATEADLRAVPHLPHARVPDLLARARDSVGSLDGPLAEELVRDQVRQVRDGSARQKRLEDLLVSAYRALPAPNHLDTIPGIGPVTAAVLTAFILDVARFPTAGHLVKYFGVLPIEAASGFTRDGTPRGPRRYVMSPRGNDLVRRYLWMAALSAARHNPAGRALYARVRAKHPDAPAVAIGHVMRKLLHLVFAIGTSGRPFDPNHYPWDRPAPVGGPAPAGPEAEPKGPAAGLKPDGPAKPEVTATGTPTVPPPAGPVDGAGPWVDFGHIRAALPMARVLDQLGLSPRLRGTGVQRRCACPIHRGDGRGRTFSVNLDLNKYQCFDARCQSQGDVIDLWAAVHRLTVRDAALDLVRTFGLSPVAGPEKRNG